MGLFNRFMSFPSRGWVPGRGAGARANLLGSNKMTPQLLSELSPKFFQKKSELSKKILFTAYFQISFAELRIMEPHGC